MKPYDLFISDFKQQEKKITFIKKKKKKAQQFTRWYECYLSVCEEIHGNSLQNTVKAWHRNSDVILKAFRVLDDWLIYVFLGGKWGTVGRNCNCFFSLFDWMNLFSCICKFLVNISKLITWFMQTLVTWDGDKLVCVQKGEKKNRGWKHWIEGDQLHLVRADIQTHSA